MQLSFTYNEIETLIREKSNQQLPIHYVAPHTINLGYQASMMGFNKEISLDISIDKIEGDDVYLTHNGGFLIQGAIKAAIEHKLKDNPSLDMIELDAMGRIVLHLAKMQRLQPILQMLRLKDLHFDEQKIMIDAEKR